MSKITFGNAIKKIGKFLLGGESDESDLDELVNNEIKLCPKCKNVMESINVYSNDFVISKVYECQRCHTISEIQYNEDESEVIRDCNIFKNIPCGIDLFSEREGIASYDNFSLNVLWSVCGVLCYPALIKTTLSDKATVIFVKVGNVLSDRNIDGFTIDSNNVIGKVQILKDVDSSHFFNPYLSNLPYPNFSFISLPTNRCEMLESVMNIRFNYTREEMNNIIRHDLTIIKDISLKCLGLIVKVSFDTDNSIDGRSNMVDIISGIHLRDIVLGNLDISTEDEFSIRSATIYKHTISSSHMHNISDDMRNDLWNDILIFFTQYDLYNRS